MTLAPDRGSRGAWPLLTGIGGLVISVVALYPGWLSFDSSYQYWQVRTGEFSNLSPVTMTALWKVVHSLGGPPAAMLVLHLVAYWSGLVLLALAMYRGAPARVAFVAALGFLPPVFVVLGHLWTDASLIAAMTLALGLMVFAGRRRWLLIVAMPVLLYAGAVRHNSLLAIVPLAWLWIRHWDGARAGASFGRHGISSGIARRLVAVLLIVAAAFGVGRALEHSLARERVSTWAIGALWDLAGVSLRTGTMLIPDFARTPGTSLESLRAKYTTYAGVPLFDGPGRVRHGLGDEIFGADEIARLRATWLAAIVDHPGAYLDHRLAVSRRLFGSYRDALEGLFFVPTAVPYRDNPPTPAALSPLREQLVAAIRQARGWPVFVPALYVALATAVLVVGFRRRNTDSGELACVVAASGLLLVLPLTVFAPSAELRYCGWLFAASAIAVAALGSTMRRGAR